MCMQSKWGRGVQVDGVDTPHQCHPCLFVFYFNPGAGKGQVEGFPDRGGGEQPLWGRGVGGVWVGDVGGVSVVFGWLGDWGGLPGRLLPNYVKTIALIA